MICKEQVSKWSINLLTVSSQIKVVLAEYGNVVIQLNNYQFLFII